MTMTAGAADPCVAEILGDPAFARLKGLVIETTGMAFYRDKDEDLARILSARMGCLGLSTCFEYLVQLQNPATPGAEMDELVAELTIGETYFFRHKEQFDALREVILPDVIERNTPFKRLRIWSAGCATGPEPYSIAIMLEREFGRLIEGWNVTILGTDINQKFLNRARDGRYDEWAFRVMPETLRTQCFEPVGRQWQIRPQFKRFVRFQYHNLIANPFPSIIDNIAGFDVIICRNVIIYFSKETVEALVPCFRETLTEGGWLIMGHSEPNQDLFRDFRTVNTPGAVLYRRDDGHSRRNAAARPSPPPPPPMLPASSVLPKLAKLTGTAVPPPPPPLLPPRPSSLGSAKPKPRAKIKAQPLFSPQPDSPPVADGMEEMRRLADSGQWEAATAACDKAITATPLNPVAHFYRAMLFEQAGDLEECEKSLRRAIYLDRRFVLPHYHLGLFLSRRDDPVGARRSFRNVLTLLECAADDQLVVQGDSITAGKMREAVAMHLKLVGEA
ncbi:Methylase of chemotaxis methyl-accepting protein [Candidatus Terasakiella magnetica]|nr:Methylase of chemotaxis methyl-accepting protein [Candidatus Terasakiella magnetica]